MTGFFFHLCNGDGCVEDEEGQDFADLAAARVGAIQALRAILAEEVNDGWLYVSSFIEIEEANNVHVDRPAVAHAQTSRAKSRNAHRYEEVSARCRCSAAQHDRGTAGPTEQRRRAPLLVRGKLQRGRSSQFGIRGSSRAFQERAALTPDAADEGLDRPSTLPPSLLAGGFFKGAHIFN